MFKVFFFFLFPMLQPKEGQKKVDSTPDPLCSSFQMFSCTRVPKLLHRCYLNKYFWTRGERRLVQKNGLVKKLCCLVAKSCLTLILTPWTVTCQTPLSMGFSRQKYQEYWCVLSCPPSGDIPNQGLNGSNSCLQHCRQVFFFLFSFFFNY